MPTELGDDLSAISGIDEQRTPPPSSDDKTEKERSRFDRARQEITIQGLQQDIREREKYASRIFRLVVCWLSSILLMVIAQGVRWPWMSRYIGFDLPESVLIALVTTTTASVVGILLIVTRYLFPQR